MKFNSKKQWALAACTAFLAVGAFAPGANAADHRDSFAVDSRPEGDFTDVFAYVDPENNENVILSFMVNSFANTGLNRSYRFAPDYLYQMKIKNNAAHPGEDLVLQVEFGGNPNPAANRGAREGVQWYRAILGAPVATGVRNQRITSGINVCDPTPSQVTSTGTTKQTSLGWLRVGNGAPNTVAFGAAGSQTAGASSVPIGQPELAGLPGVGMPTQGVSREEATYTTTVAGSPGKCFAGIADDSFQTDAAQAIFRQGLNSSQSVNNQDHSQELFRGFGGAGSILSGLRGRPVRLDGTSGVDSFGGFSGSAVAISIPKRLLTGSGIPDVSQGGAINPNLIGVWGTVSAPTSETFDGWTSTDADGTYAQFERMGQQIAATTFMFQQPIRNSGRPLTVADWNAAGVNGPTIPGSTTRYTTVAENKDLYNATNVTEDVRLFDRFYPDSLTQASIGTPSCPGLIGQLLCDAQNAVLGGNTVKGRAALLTILGFNSFGINGVPLFPASVGLSGNTNPRLQAQLGNPDYMRLNVNVPTDGPVRPGAATAGNTSATLGLYKWGLQNGRRPADDVTDIVLRLTREVADVKFPTTLVLPGIPAGAIVPGSQLPDARRAVNCDELQIAGSATSALIGSGGLAALLVPGASDGLLGQLSINVLHPCEDARVFVVVQGTDFIEPADHLESVADQYSATNNTLLPTFPYFGDSVVKGEPGTTEYGAQN